MELDIEENLKNYTNEEIGEFTNELNQSLSISDVKAYSKPIDIGIFTDENYNKIMEKYNELIAENSISDDTKGTICEVSSVNQTNSVINEYDSASDTFDTYYISNAKLPVDCKKGTILRKVDDTYMIDRELMSNIYYEMKEYETDILNEQQNTLSKMRKNGDLYYVKKVERRL